MTENLREKLLCLAEKDYQKFSASLLPNLAAETILGVRLPKLRQLAKEIARGDWRSFLAQAPSDYFEEVMIQGMVIGYAPMELPERFTYVTAFVPKIHSWSVCDSFCGGLKFTHDHKAAVWTFLQPYFFSQQEYEVRFAVVMILEFYIEEAYLPQIFSLFDQISHEGYYVKMAVAWALSLCYIHLPDATNEYLQANQLDDFTYNKALQKITESYRISPETKAAIRAMKRPSAKSKKQR
ncbi:MAG: DNA alkylation repair protein [Sporomusaceae bacterium]|nr:DNA alkylation repair protein [Sporomusaceae bacterium]